MIIDDLLGIIINNQVAVLSQLGGSSPSVNLMGWSLFPNRNESMIAESTTHSTSQNTGFGFSAMIVVER